MFKISTLAIGTGAITNEALTAYIAVSDVVGACPAVRLQGSQRETAQWVMLSAICNAYAGEGALAASQLNAAQNEEIAPEIDLLLAQRFAGAAGRGRGGTTVSWEGVETLSPWRFSLATAVGETIPAAVLNQGLQSPSGSYYRLAGAVTPAVPLDRRMEYADYAAQRGVFSASALVGLYSELYNNEGLGGEAAQRASRLRQAYVVPDAASRITAMRGLWPEGEGRYTGQILTAYAAARISPSAEYLPDANALIASMLTAGLDRDAAAWSGTVEAGSLGWGFVGCGRPRRRFGINRRARWLYQR